MLIKLKENQSNKYYIKDKYIGSYVYFKQELRRNLI